MKLVAGLGNPGSKYLMTRHNIGFMAIDALAQAQSVSYKTEQKAQVCKIRCGDEQALLVKPQTFMNLSGESIQPLMEYYKVAMEDLLVVHDEVDLPYSALRYQTNRGHGGHNGIRNIHQMLGTKDYGRLKLGVGRSSNPNIETVDHVLQNFSKDEQKTLGDFISYSAESIEFWIENNLNLAATRYNRSH